MLTIVVLILTGFHNYGDHGGLIWKSLIFYIFQVEKLGRDCFFFLRQSFPFDEASFGVLTDKLTTKKPMVVSRATSYVFSLHPPSDLQFGDYATVFNKRLHAGK